MSVADERDRKYGSDPEAPTTCRTLSEWEKRLRAAYQVRCPDCRETVVAKVLEDRPTRP